MWAGNREEFRFKKMVRTDWWLELCQTFIMKPKTTCNVLVSNFVNSQLCPGSATLFLRFKKVKWNSVPNFDPNVDRGQYWIGSKNPAKYVILGETKRNLGGCAEFTLNFWVCSNPELRRSHKNKIWRKKFTENEIVLQSSTGKLTMTTHHT